MCRSILRRGGTVWKIEGCDEFTKNPDRHIRYNSFIDAMKLQVSSCICTCHDTVFWNSISFQSRNICLVISVLLFGQLFLGDGVGAWTCGQLSYISKLSCQPKLEYSEVCYHCMLPNVLTFIASAIYMFKWNYFRYSECIDGAMRKSL